MSVLSAPEFRGGMPWAMKRWPHLTRRWVQYRAHCTQAPWRAAYLQRSREAMVLAGIHSRAVEVSVSRLPSEFIADVALLRHASDRTVRSLPIRIAGSPIESIAQARLHGRGLILGCSNFGCFYHALLASGGIFGDVLVVIGGPVPRGEQALRERIEAISGARIRLVQADRHSGITVARQLAAGGVVATMLDTYLPTTDRLVAPFLGRPAASPAGIYRLASRYGATTIPVFCLRRKGFTEIELGPLIPGAGLEPAEIAATVNLRVGEKILEEPGQWMMWHKLEERWAHGASTESATAARSVKCPGDIALGAA